MGCFEGLAGRLMSSRRGLDVKVAIPRKGDNVAPCFGHCAMMSIYTLTDGEVASRVDFPLRSHDPLDRVRLLRDQKVETIICGGVQEYLENCLAACGIQVISWVSGPVVGLLELFLRGQLVSRREQPASVGPNIPSPQIR
jgi:predicted Fe-Mo cluster-binding NifX family protein